MPLRLDVFHYFPQFEPGQLDRIEVSLSSLLRKVNTIMATGQDVKDLAVAIKTKVGEFQAAVDAAEARLTAAIAAGSPITQADLDEIFGTLNDVLTGASSAVSDLTDGVDEGAAPAP